MWNSFQKTHYLVFLVINRLATYRESEVSTLNSEKWNMRISGTVLSRGGHISWVKQNSFNLTSDNSALEKTSPKTGSFAFYQRKTSSMKQADLRDMFKRASKSVCTSTVVISPDPYLLLHQLLELWRLQHNRRWPWWPWTSRWRYPNGILLWLLVHP
jgi:hypothetical protein